MWGGPAAVREYGPMDDCLFCSIVAGDVPADIVRRDDRTVAFRDINPQAPVHVLIVPRRHITDAGAVTPGDAEELTALVTAPTTPPTVWPTPPTVCPTPLATPPMVWPTPPIVPFTLLFGPPAA